MLKMTRGILKKAKNSVAQLLSLAENDGSPISDGSILGDKIIMGSTRTAKSKIDAFTTAGVPIAEKPSGIVKLLKA